MKQKINKAAEPELAGQFMAASAVDYNRFKTDRESLKFDEKCRVADAMFRCYRNSEVAKQEKAAVTGLDMDDEDTNSSMASARFLRFCLQKQGFITSLLLATDTPFTYSPITNKEVFASAEDGADQAAIQQTLAMYSWEEDDAVGKLQDWAIQLAKYGNVPIMVEWHEERRRVKLVDQDSGKSTWKEVTTSAYPTLRVIGWDMLYADAYAGPIEKQDCVIVLSVVTWSDIIMGMKNGWYDKEQVELIRANRKQFVWDGSEGATFREYKAENEGLEGYDPSSSGLFLQWDIYRQAPIKGSEWDDTENDPTLWWMTAIGNSLPANIQKSTGGDVQTMPSAVPLRLTTDFSPTGKINIFMSNALPDDMDMLYHVGHAEAIRPLYSIECRLWEQTIDGNDGVNHPMIAFDSTMLNAVPDSMAFAPGGTIDIQDPARNIKEFGPRSVLSENINLINAIQEEQEVSQASSANQSGQSFGGRTSATESMQINRFSDQPRLAEVYYALGRTLRFIGQQYAACWQGCAPEQLVHAIADERLPRPVYIDKLQKDKESRNIPSNTPIYGSFDVKLTVLDELIRNYVDAQQELQLIERVAQNQVLQKSDSHQVDFGYWLQSILHRMKVKESARIVQPLMDSDAHVNQREELKQMQETGELLDIGQGENDHIHITVCKAEILRYKPILSADPELIEADQRGEQSTMDFYINQLVVPHMEMHEARVAQRQQGGGEVQPGGSLPNQPGLQSLGQQTGGVIAGAMGG